MKIIKKDKTLAEYDEQKIISACDKAASRALVKLDNDDYSIICNKVLELISDENYFVEEYGEDIIPVSDMHSLVENALIELYPKVGQAYQQYRNYKIDFVGMLDKVYSDVQSIKYIGDRTNANTDSALVSTQKSLAYNSLNSELYKKFFLTTEELQAHRDGYIYVHDMSARRDTMNCCLALISNVLNGGFEMGNIWYNEPKSLDVAFDVIGDIVLNTASQQYGGYTIPRVDEILSKYAEMSYQDYVDKYINKCHMNRENAENLAWEDVVRDAQQGWQGWEYKFNSVASSRGDYPFITVTMGLATDRFGKMIAIEGFNNHREGQGKKGFKRPTLFPKYVFLYDEKLHGDGRHNEPNADVYEAGIACSAKTMYPDWLSLTGEGYVAEMYKKYGVVVSPMGCRAFLSPWYERGGMHPADENDKPVFEGRFNLGVISLNLPMILAKSKQENKDFYEVLNYYLELIRNLHKRTYDYIGEFKASTNPVMYCQGGFYGGNLNPDDKIKSILKPMTMSFGITALNELQRLYNGKSIREDGQFALDVMNYINAYVDRIKEEDGILWALYGTPAEVLAGKQVEQFRKKYGIIENVSDREYVSNSFHCHVTEDMSPIEKQDKERRFWNLMNGGKIQYCRYPLNYNIESMRSLIQRAMGFGFYEGVNLALSYCEDCGYEQLEMDECPQCGSKTITKIDRMNGYLQYSRVKGDTRSNAAKLTEIAERVSM